MEINRDNLLALIKNGVKRDALSIAGLEKQAGVPRDTVRDFMRGKTHVLRADKLQKILRILGPKVTITGYVGEGAEIIPVRAADKKIGEEVECPQGYEPSDVVAIRVRGDGMLPMFHDGWIIYYSRREDTKIHPINGGGQVPYGKTGKTRQEPFAAFIGKPCVIGIPGGRVLLGTLKRTATSENYSLTNYNAYDIRKIKPVWAAKIILIKPE
jgi:predicted XRE-type DNA-binding protein